LTDTGMGKTSLVEAIKQLDLEQVRNDLRKKPELKAFRTDQGFDLLQFCVSRPTWGDRATANRQLRLAKWLVSEGFDPRVIHMTKPGEDGEADPTPLSLVFIAIARAQNNPLARFFIEQGAKPMGLFAAAWWGNWEILEDLVKHGEHINTIVGAPPLHMAVAVLLRDTEGKPEFARRRVKTVEEFFRLGADPNIPDDRGNTILHVALDKGFDVSFFKLLLKHGANPDLPGKDGRTVRDIASRKRDKRYINAIES
jgi:hypothetical protein